mmetsp:Transcript_113139/g.221841  ORF Transcript_113139/g.221841 Transcript_113139/m.221841 type:complete len:267 (-) Transcript_113139:386-1186(-)
MAARRFAFAVILHAKPAEKEDMVGIHQCRCTQEALLVRDLHRTVSPPRGASTAVHLALAATFALAGLCVDALRRHDRLQTCRGPVFGQEGSSAHGDIHRGRRNKQSLSHLGLVVMRMQLQPTRVLPLPPLIPPPRSLGAPIVVASVRLLVLPSPPTADVVIVVAFCLFRIVPVALFLLVGNLGIAAPTAVAGEGVVILPVHGFAIDQLRPHQLVPQGVPRAEKRPQSLRHEEARGGEVVCRVHPIAARFQPLLKGLCRGIASEQIT